MTNVYCLNALESVTIIFTHKGVKGNPIKIITI